VFQVDGCMIVRFAAAPWLIEKDKKASRFEPSCPHRNFLGVIIFGSVRFLSKKVTKLKFFFWKKTETEPKPGQTDQFRFGSVLFFRAKTGSNRFGSVFPVLARFSRFWLGFFRFWLGFFRFSSVFLVWLGFGSVFPVWLCFGSVFFPVFCRFRFGSVRFFWFFVYKTKTEPNRPVFSKN